MKTGVSAPEVHYSTQPPPANVFTHASMWPPEAKFMPESNWTTVRVSIPKPTPEFSRFIRAQIPARYKFNEDWILECHRLLSAQSRQVRSLFTTQ